MFSADSSEYIHPVAEPALEAMMPLTLRQGWAIVLARGPLCGSGG
jgi:hypothetical protein